MMKNNLKSILVFGDSILKGIIGGITDSKRFEVIEENSLQLAGNELGIEIINKSVFGSTIQKTQKTMNRCIKSGTKADICIIESGGNDADYDWTLVSENPDGEHLQRCPIEDFDRILDEIVKTARENGITPVIMTLPPLVGDWWYENICIGQNVEAVKKFVGDDIYRLYRNQELYSLHAAEYARKNGVQLVDMRSAMLAHKNYREIMCHDGIHPNREGYRYMAEIWKKELPEIRLEF